MHRLAARHEISLVYLRSRMSRRWVLNSGRGWLMARRWRTRRVDPLATESTGRQRRQAGGSLGQRRRVMTYAANPMAYFAVHRTRRQEGSMGPPPHARCPHAGATSCALGGAAFTSPVPNRALSDGFSAAHRERWTSIPSGIDPSAVPLGASTGAYRQPRSAP
jgi:hypothetical protein